MTKVFTAQKTNKTLMFCFPVPPSGNTRKKGRISQAHSGKQYVGVRVSKQHADYKRAVSNAALYFSKELNFKPFKKDVDLSLHVNWYRARKSGDVDNRWKDVLDGMEGYVYENDSQIKSMKIDMFDDEKERKNPRIELKITPLTHRRPAWTMNTTKEACLT